MLKSIDWFNLKGRVDITVKLNIMHIYFCFDYFATFLLQWTRKLVPGPNSKYYSLSNLNYDTKINILTKYISPYGE